MNPFEQYELKDISEAIPPEEAFPWIDVVIITTLIMILAFVIRLIISKRNQLFRKIISKQSKDSLPQLTKHLKKIKNNDHKDFDKAWLFALHAMADRKLISQRDLTLEDFRDELFSGNKLKMGDQSVINELLSLIENHKYNGGLGEKDTQQLYACFIELTQKLTTY